jgi:hypothetical protein
MRAIDGHATERGFALLEREPTMGRLSRWLTRPPYLVGGDDARGLLRYDEAGRSGIWHRHGKPAQR